MNISAELVQEALEIFVDHFNHQKYKQAGDSYAIYAVKIFAEQIILGRDSIIQHYSNINDFSITNYHLGTLDISHDGRHALTLVKYTIACKNSDNCYAFRQCCSSLLFELDTEEILIVSDTMIILDDC
jgi:hypothetical protein